MLTIIVHMPGDEMAEYRLPPTVPLSFVATEVGAELGAPAYTIWFEDATSGMQFKDTTMTLGEVFPGATRIGLVAQCDASRPKPVVPGRENEPEYVGKLGSHRDAPGLAAAHAAVAIAQAQAAAAAAASAGSAGGSPPNSGRAAAAVPAYQLKPVIPVSMPPHLSANGSPPVSARSEAPHIGRASLGAGTGLAAPSAASSGPASGSGSGSGSGAGAVAVANSGGIEVISLPTREVIQRVLAACREIEPELAAAIAAVPTGGSAASGTPVHAAATAKFSSALAAVPLHRAAVLRRHGFACEAELKDARSACCRAATALTDRQAPPGHALATAASSVNVLDTNGLSADVIFQSTGLGLAVVWANKLSKTEERLAKVAAEAGVGAAALLAPAPSAAAASLSSPAAAAAQASSAQTAPSSTHAAAKPGLEPWQLVALGAAGATLAMGLGAVLAVAILTRDRSSGRR